MRDRKRSTAARTLDGHTYESLIRLTSFIISFIFCSQQLGLSKYWPLDSIVIHISFIQEFVPCNTYSKSERSNKCAYFETVTSFTLTQVVMNPSCLESYQMPTLSR